MLRDCVAGDMDAERVTDVPQDCAGLKPVIAQPIFKLVLVVHGSSGLLAQSSAHTSIRPSGPRCEGHMSSSEEGAN